MAEPGNIGEQGDYGNYIEEAGMISHKNKMNLIFYIFAPFDVKLFPDKQKNTFCPESHHQPDNPLHFEIDEGKANHYH
jgi:hypothetical protein